MNRIATLTGFYLCSIFCSSLVLAQDEATSPVEALEGSSSSSGLSFELSVFYWNKYLDNTGGIVNLDRPVVQTDLILSFDSGLYLELWNSTGLNGGGLSSDYGDELDLFVGWTEEVELLGVNLDLGVAYFDILPVGTLTDTDVIQPFIAVSKNFDVAEGQTLSPFIRTEFIFGGANTNQGETYFHFGLEHAVEFTDALSLGHKIEVQYDPGIYDFDAGWIGEYAIQFDWNVSKTITLTPISVRISTPLSDVNDERGTEFVWGFGGTISF